MLYISHFIYDNTHATHTVSDSRIFEAYVKKTSENRKIIYAANV